MVTPNWSKIITLRPHTKDDLPFMKNLYLSTRENELALTNFTRHEKQEFIKQQFKAQYSHYLKFYHTDAFNIIEAEGFPIGRLFVDYMKRDIRIVDIALISAYRNRGVGTYLFNLLFSEATQSQRSLSIHVEYNNPAKKLYERLGFTLKAKTNDIYLLMEWQPDSVAITD